MPVSLYEVLTYGAWWFVFVGLAVILAFLLHLPGVILGWLCTVCLVGQIDTEHARSMARPDWEFKMPFVVLAHAFWIVVFTAPLSYLAIRLRRRWGFWFPYWWRRKAGPAE